MTRSRLRGATVAVALLGLVLAAEGGFVFAKAELAQWLLEAAWRRALRSDPDDGPHGSVRTELRPWPWADTWPVARLSIPRVDASMIVLAGGTGRTLAFGPGHTAGTSLPGGPGTAILSGHRDTHFAVLRALERGDALDVERPDGHRVRYRVTRTDVVDARDTRLRAPADRPALLLVTCWPFDALIAGGPLRYVVTADRDESAEPVAMSIAPPETAARRGDATRVIGSGHDAAQAEVLGLGGRGRGPG